MALIVTCVCGQWFQARPELAGRQMPCPMCGQTLAIPQQPQTAPQSGFSTIRSPLGSPLPQAANPFSFPATATLLGFENTPHGPQNYASSAGDGLSRLRNAAAHCGSLQRR